MAEDAIPVKSEELQEISKKAVFETISNISKSKYDINWRIITDISQTLMAIGTLLLAVFTTLLWKSTQDLRNFSEQQTNIMKDQLVQAKLSIDASNRQAKDAEDANYNTLFIAQKQMRPQIFWDGDAITTYKLNDNTHTVYETVINFRNAGATFAYNVKGYGVSSLLRIDNANAGPKFVLPVLYNSDTDNFNNAPISVIGPGEIHKSNIPPAMPSDEEVKDFIDNKYVLVTWGILYYSDNFHINHHFRYCFYTKYTDMQTSANANNCGIHNDAD